MAQESEARRKISGITIATILVLSSLISFSTLIYTAPVVSADYGVIPTNGTNWCVTQNTYINGGDYWVKNISVNTGFTLIIKDSHILIRSYQGAVPSLFQVNRTGGIVILNSTIDSYDDHPWKGWFKGEYVYGGGDGYRAMLVKLDNSTLRGFAGHHLDAKNGLVIQAPQSGSYIYNCLFSGFVLLYPDLQLYNSTHCSIDIDGMTFWGTVYDFMIYMSDATQPPLNVKNLILTRGFAQGADYPVSVNQYGGGGAGAIVNFTNPIGRHFGGVATLYSNHTVDLYTPTMFNIKYGGGVPYNIIRTSEVYAYDDDFQPLTDARVVISNLDGEYYNETIDGYASVDVLVGKNLTVPGQYTHLWRYPITFRIYNDTYDYTRVVTQAEWEYLTLFSNDFLFVSSNNLTIQKNKFQDNHNFGWTFYSDTDRSDPAQLTPVVEYMSSVGMRASWTVWGANQDPSEFTTRLGPGLVNSSAVREFVNLSRDLGHTIGYHMASGGNDTREEFIGNLEEWYSMMGWYPLVNYDHSNNQENNQIGGSKGADPALPRTYYNIDYSARLFEYDRVGALCAGYQPDTFKYPHAVVGGLGYYALVLAPNSTEMYRGSVQNLGYGYAPMFFNETLNNISDRLIWYRFHASGMDCPWQYTWEQWETVDEERGFFIGSGHWGAVANGAIAGNGWSKQISGLPVNYTFNPADPNYSIWDPDGTYVINDTLTSGISGKSLFDGLSLMDGSYIPVEEMMNYLVLLDGEDWLEDVLHDNAEDDDLKMMGGIEIFNQGNQITVENRNDEVVPSVGLILNQNITLVNGTSYYYPNSEHEINLGDFPARTQRIYTISTDQIDIDTECFVGYFAQNTNIYLNLTNRKNGDVSIEMPSGWNASRIRVYDVTDGEYIMNWTEGSIEFYGEGGHGYRVFQSGEPGPCSFEWIVSGRSASFTDTSTMPDIETWSWDFGDGETSTEQNPVHMYDGAGTYTVILNVTDEFGAYNVTEADVVILTEAEMINNLTGVLIYAVGTVVVIGVVGRVMIRPFGRMFKKV